MNCCPNCFSDHFLQNRIISISKADGRCGYCNSEHSPLVAPEELTDYFEALLDIYVHDTNGILLDKLIQDDWETFKLNEEPRRKLVKELMSIEDEADLKFSPKHERNQAVIELWNEFKEELRHNNRFLPKKAPEKQLFIQFGPLLGVLIKPSSRMLYRARLNGDKLDFTVHEMGKPPTDVVLNGRANPIGISYLYAASDSKTAIAEVRGHKGEVVTVIEYDIVDQLDLFEIINPKNTISPFEKIEELEFIYKHMPYLEMLGFELASPVIPKKANLDYLASQYLCEMIKDIGYHGIIFRSSLSSGYNYVLFSDHQLKAGRLTKHKITSVEYKSEQLVD